MDNAHLSSVSLVQLQWPVDNAPLSSVSLVQPQWPVDNAHLSSVSLVQLQWPVDNAHLSPVNLVQLHLTFASSVNVTKKFYFCKCIVVELFLCFFPMAIAVSIMSMKSAANNWIH